MPFAVCVSHSYLHSASSQYRKERGGEWQERGVAARKRNEVMQHFSLIYFDGILEEEPIKLSRLQRADTLEMRQLSAHTAHTQRECQVGRVQVSACDCASVLTQIKHTRICTNT